MKTTDPIADLLTRIRNAAMAGKSLVHVPHSKMKEAICEVLVNNGYLVSASTTGEGIEKALQLELKENMQDLHIKRISKPGQRIYLGVKDIPRVLDGLGMAVLSTPKGVMSGNKAKRLKVGGEYICEVY